MSEYELDVLIFNYLVKKKKNCVLVSEFGLFSLLSTLNNQVINLDWFPSVSSGKRNVCVLTLKLAKSASVTTWATAFLYTDTVVDSGRTRSPKTKLVLFCMSWCVFRIPILSTLWRPFFQLMVLGKVTDLWVKFVLFSFYLLKAGSCHTPEVYPLQIIKH